MMNRRFNKVVTSVVLAALIATSAVPAAQADRDRNESGRRGDRGKQVYAPGHQKQRGKQYDRDRGRDRYRGRHVERRRAPERVVRYVYRGPRVVERHYYRDRHRDGHPGIAFLGGLILGAVISNSHAHADHHFYADPYCDARFSSLDAYYAHTRYHDHPQVVHVIEVRTGNWVDSYTWHRGGWRQYETDRWECGW